DLLRTHCRGAQSSTPTLSELPRGAHCPSCNIDYDRDFEKNVELSFAPAPAVRPLGVGGYCLSGPMATPHVAVQVLLAPGETRTIRADLPSGPYRLRTLHPGDHVDIEHHPRHRSPACGSPRGASRPSRRARRARSPSRTMQASSSPP